MKIGICDDRPTEIIRVKKLIDGMQSLDEELIIEEYNPDSLCVDLTEGFFDCQILITDIYFGQSGTGEKAYDGVDMAALINRRYPLCKIIFISQYMVFTEHVYRTDHIYFILKKNLEYFLEDAIRKAIAAYNDDAREDFVEFFHKSQKTWVKLRDIYSVEKDERNIKILTESGEYICIKSLRRFANEIKEEPIVRCNNATLVNLRHAKSITAKRILLENGKEYEISSTYSNMVKKQYLCWWQKRI
ncbi:MAG: response regulator transcription factor [Lachnospiraceae bacterium]|nr:response regulator transcription factor [Lachnospiraceae bacterium]